MDGFPLQNGNRIPYIGYGTGVVDHYARNPYLWTKQKARLILNSVKRMQINRQLKLDLFADKLVRQAYDAGFRLFDTGRIYGASEKSIGKGLRGIARKNYFLVTKFSDSCFQMTQGGGAGENTVLGHLKRSLDFLQTEYVDLLLIHHPHGSVAEIWAQMESAQEMGLCRMIGTSNFTVSDLRELQKTQKIAPVVNQGERHPFFQNNEVFDYCRENHILFMAHTPTGYGKVGKSETVLKLAEKYKKTPQQIVLRWDYQCGVVPVVSTVNRTHMREAVDIFDFRLSAEEMEKLAALQDNIRLLDCVNGIDNPNYRFNL